MAEYHVQNQLPAAPGTDTDDDAGKLLLVKLVQEYAEYHRAAFDARRELRDVRVPVLFFGICGSIAFVVCGILLVIDLAVGLNGVRGTSSVALGVGGMVPGLFVATVMTAAFFGKGRELSRKIETAERDKEGVLYRLRLAIPRLDVAGGRTLLERGLARGITTRRTSF